MIGRRAVVQFWRAGENAQQPDIENRSRLFKVVKTPVSADNLPPELAQPLSQVVSFDFYEEDPATGRVREFDERFGPEARQRYFERVYDVAQEIHRVLTAVKDRPADQSDRSNKDSGKTVYLATSTSDLRADVDKIRRELIARGHDVVPDRPLPLVGSELETAVREYLQRADLAVHPIGAHYGLIPEGSELSIVELQNRVAAAHTHLPRIIWLPRDLQPRDAKQETLIRALRDDPELHRGAEIVQNNLETLKGVVLDKLSPPPLCDTEATTNEGASVSRVYLICDKTDESAVEALEDFLFERGLEVSLPDFQADEAEAGEIHRQNLLDCDAVLVYYGSARHAWVDIKLRNVLKAGGYGRSRDFTAQAVYVAAPLDRRKERFRSHTADVIREVDRFDPALLESFARQVAQSRGGDRE